MAKVMTITPYPMREHAVTEDGVLAVVEEGGELKPVEVPGSVVKAAGMDLNLVGRALGDVLNQTETAGKFGAVGLIAGLAGFGLLLYLAGRKG